MKTIIWVFFYLFCSQLQSQVLSSFPTKLDSTDFFIDINAPREKFIVGKSTFKNLEDKKIVELYSNEHKSSLCLVPIGNSPNHTLKLYLFLSLYYFEEKYEGEDFSVPTAYNSFVLYDKINDCILFSFLGHGGGFVRYKNKIQFNFDFDDIRKTHLLNDSLCKIATLYKAQDQNDSEAIYIKKNGVVLISDKKNIDDLEYEFILSQLKKNIHKPECEQKINPDFMD